ncbi:MAG: DUF1573 domain-containing protein [Deltaproteobacteria bacterium]|jgi:hypothetical protein|nr:DUF1573 domain-containing protein [Deltaproteobacteria bacterium]
MSKASRTAFAAALAFGLLAPALFPAAIAAQEGEEATNSAIPQSRPSAPKKAAAAPAAAAAGPRLQVAGAGPVFNVGTSQPGTTVRHVFEIKNSGTEPLIITQVVPACGCTVASYDEFIAPGKTGKVTVSLELYREWAGEPYDKTVTVVTNDPKNPRIRLAMRGRVAPGGSSRSR